MQRGESEQINPPGCPATRKEFDWYSEEITKARAECEKAYIAWSNIAEKLKRLERERDLLFCRMLDEIIGDRQP